MVQKEEEKINLKQLQRDIQFKLVTKNSYPLPHVTRVALIDSNDLDGYVTCSCIMKLDTNNKAKPSCTDNQCDLFASKTECMPGRCPVSQTCQNQRLQNPHLLPKILPFHAGEKGYGIKACRNIKIDEMVAEYVGEVIDDEELKYRLSNLSSDEKNFYFLEVKAGIYIDSRHRGGLSRFINHSCNPNCSAQKWSVNGEDRIAIVSLRYINEGEEITFDYGWKTFGNESLTCYCQSENCHGKLSNDKTNNEAKSFKKDEINSPKEEIVKKKDSFIIPKIKNLSNIQSPSPKLPIKSLKPIQNEEDITKSENFNSGLHTAPIFHNHKVYFPPTKALLVKNLQLSLLNETNFNEIIIKRVFSSIININDIINKIEIIEVYEKRNNEVWAMIYFNNMNDSLLFYEKMHSSFINGQKLRLFYAYHREMNYFYSAKKEYEYIQMKRKEKEEYAQEQRKIQEKINQEKLTQEKEKEKEKELKKKNYSFGISLPWTFTKDELLKPLNIELPNSKKQEIPAYAQILPNINILKRILPQENQNILLQEKIKNIFTVAKVLHINRTDAAKAAILVQRYFAITNINENNIHVIAPVAFTIILKCLGRQFNWNDMIIEHYTVEFNNNITNRKNNINNNNKIVSTSSAFLNYEKQIIEFEKEFLLSIRYDVCVADPLTYADNIMKLIEKENPSIHHFPHFLKNNARELIIDNLSLKFWLAYPVEILVFSFFYILTAFIIILKLEKVECKGYEQVDININENDSIYFPKYIPNISILLNILKTDLNDTKETDAIINLLFDAIKDISTSKAFEILVHLIVKGNKKRKIDITERYSVKIPNNYTKPDKLLPKIYSIINNWIKNNNTNDIIYDINNNNNNIKTLHTNKEFFYFDSMNYIFNNNLNDNFLNKNDLIDCRPVKKRTFLARINNDNIKYHIENEKIIVTNWSNEELKDKSRNIALKELYTSQVLHQMYPDLFLKPNGIIFPVVNNNDNIQPIKNINSLSTELEDNGYYLTFERPLHTLASIMESKQQLNTNMKKKIAFELIKAIDKCHEQNMIHRFISPQNVSLFDKDIKLSGLRYVCHIDNKNIKDKNKYYYKLNQSEWNESCYGSLLKITAPEILLGDKNYNQYTDMWSLGCVLLQLFSNHSIPFKGTDIKMQLDHIFRICGTPNSNFCSEMISLPNYTKYKPFKGYRERLKKAIYTINNNLIQEEFEIINHLLQLDPLKRMKPKDLLKLSYFKSIHLNHIRFSSFDKSFSSRRFMESAKEMKKIIDLRKENKEKNSLKRKNQAEDTHYNNNIIKDKDKDKDNDTENSKQHKKSKYNHINDNSHSMDTNINMNHSKDEEDPFIKYIMDYKDLKDTSLNNTNKDNIIANSTPIISPTIPLIPTFPTIRMTPNINNNNSTTNKRKHDKTSDDNVCYLFENNKKIKI